MAARETLAAEKMQAAEKMAEERWRAVRFGSVRRV